MRPAPIIDEQLERDERFGPGILGDKGLVAVGRQHLAVDFAFSVLAAHGAAEHILGAYGLYRPQYLRLFVPDGIGLERDGRLHGGQAE